MNEQIKFKNRYKIIKYLMILGALLFWFSISLYSKMDGIAGRTSTTSSGCDCHSTNSSSATTVSNTSGSGSYVFTPGSTNSFTVTVAHATKPKMGLGIAVKTTQTGNTNAGTLSPGAGLKLLSGELVHITSIAMSGGQATVSFTWTAPTTPGTYYLRAIGNAVNDNGSEDAGDIWNWMTVQPLTVSAPGGSITVTAPNGGESWCAGTQQNITWTSSGVTTVKLEASSDGGTTFASLATGVSASAGTWAWNIPSGQQAGTQYKVKITDESNASVNDASNANFTILQGLTITTQPQSTSACSGSSAQFSITANGNGITYQWRKGGSNINGATASTYSITSVTAADAGSYDCVLNSSCGSPVTSNPATLTVNETPAITAQPQSQTVCKSDNATFSVTATGSNLTYQWKKNGANINGATNATLSLMNVQASDSGQYTVDVSGLCPPTQTSQAASLTVNLPPSIVTQPQADTVCSGQGVTFGITASGSNLTYKWYKNGIELPNSNAPTYSIASASINDAGNYNVVVSNNCNPSASSSNAQLVVNDVPVIVNQPVTKNVEVGAAVTFTINATGAASYQWRKNSVNIQGKTTETLTLNNVQLADSGSYDCVLTNTCGNVTSETAKLTVKPAGAGILSLSSYNVNFGTVVVGESRDSLFTGMITNTGSANLNLTGMSMSGTDKNDFEIIVNPAPCMIMPQQSKNISLKFVPAAGGNRNASLNLTCNMGDTSIALKGFGGIIGVASSKNSILFDSININTNVNSSIMLNNTGNMNAKITKLEISGTQSAFFTVVSPSTPFTVDSGASQEVTLAFSPLVPGLATAKMNVTVEKLQNNITIDLSGTALFVGVADNNLTNYDLTAYPNPFGNHINIKFETGNGIGYVMEVYDILGNLVKSFAQEETNGGIVELNWDGTNNEGKGCGTGRYVCVIRTGNKLRTIGIDLIR